MRFTALALLLVVAVVAADVAPLLHADSPTVIPGSYLVILKKGLDVLARDAHILNLKDTIVARSAQDSEVGWVYNIGSFIGFSARLSEELLKIELAHPDVEYIECDQVMSINDVQEQAPQAIITQTGATWGIDRVDQRALPLNGLYTYNDQAGAGVDVYVIDTGILVTHNEFVGRATFVFSSITGEANTDLNGHGTHCAGTVAGTLYGVAKKATLYAVKVLNAGGSGTTAGVIAGVNYVTTNQRAGRKSVGSMSLGGGISQTLDDAVTASVNAGVAYSIAAETAMQTLAMVPPLVLPLQLLWEQLLIPMYARRSRATDRVSTSSLLVPPSPPLGLAATLQPIPSVEPLWPPPMLLVPWPFSGL